MTDSPSTAVQALYHKAVPPEVFQYPPIEPKSFVLKKGAVIVEGAMPLGSDILVEHDVAVRLRDGATIRADVFRPVDGTDCPAIIGWSPYGKRGGGFNLESLPHPTRMDVPRAWEDGLNKFEAANPAYWVAHGYAIISPDPRGVGRSEGNMHAFGPEEAQDEYDLIEWAGTQPWSNGKVGLSGNSWLAITQWYVASLRPPHLAAIAPWEGGMDFYRDTLCRGGIPNVIFAEMMFGRMFGHGMIEDVPAMAQIYPLFNAYWEAKVAAVEQIDVPTYVVGSWTNFLHTYGTFVGWQRLRSDHNWLRVHNTHEWNDFYNPDNVEELRRFFDRYLKGEANDWEATPRVRLAVLDPGGNDTLGRVEQEFPLARQQFTPLYLNGDGPSHVLATVPSGTESTFSYDSATPAGITFHATFDRDTEITGYMTAKLWVSAPDHDDMDIFVYVRKIGTDGNPLLAKVATGATHVGANGRLRVSLRGTDAARSTPGQPYMTFDRPEKLRPNEIVPVEIGFWPYAMRWRAGETLELQVCSADLTKEPVFTNLPPVPTLNLGRHVIHTGGSYDSHLLVPIIPS